MKLFFFDIKPSTLSVALSLVLLSGCATMKDEPEQWLSDKNLVLQSLQEAHVSSAKLQESFAALDQRVIDLERENAEQKTKIEILESAVRAQKANKAKPSRRANDVKQQTVALNKRLDEMSAKLVVPSVSAKVAADAAASEEKNAYTAAYLALKSGRYDEASSGFVNVIKAHPKGEYTDQAYYWLGESLVALRRHKEALESFTVVANKYPKSAKHAAALLKIASVYQSMQQIGDARAALKRVIKEYPDSKTAERARAQLDALAGSGAKP